MARTPRRSLSGSATAVARRVLSRRGTTDETEAPSVKKATKKSPAKKATATKAAKATSAGAQKTTAKKTPAKKTTAKKAATKQAPAKKAATKAPAKKTTGTKTPAKKAATKQAPAKKAATKATAKKAATKKAPAKKTTTTKAATKKAPTKKSPAKKKSAKATGPIRRATEARARALPVREGEQPWTKDELAEVLDDLNAHRDRIEGMLADHEVELADLMRDAGDGAGQDQADIGTSTFERDQEITVLNNEREMLLQIDKAMTRIGEGTYGICESCGNPIGKGRLMAFPRASLCLTCKQREERR